MPTNTEKKVLWGLGLGTGFLGIRLLFRPRKVKVSAILDMSGVQLHADGSAVASVSGSIKNSGSVPSPSLIVRVYGRIAGSAVMPTAARQNPVDYAVGPIFPGASAGFSAQVQFLDTDPDGPVTARVLLMNADGVTVYKTIDSPQLGTSGHFVLDFNVVFSGA